MTKVRWTTSKLGSWRSSPLSSRRPHSCCCFKRRHRPTIRRTTAAARLIMNSLITSSPKGRSPQTARTRGPLARMALLPTRAPLAESTHLKRKARRPTTGPSKRREARTTAMARRGRDRGTRGRRTLSDRLRVRSRVRSRHLVAVKGVMARTGRIRAMVRTTMVRTTRTTTPVMDRHRRTATVVAARAGHARGASVTPTTSSRRGKPPTAPITTTATSATGTAASVRRIRLTPDANRRHPRHVAPCHRVVSNHRHHVVSNHLSHRGPHVRCRPTRCFPSHRSTGRLHVLRSRSFAPPQTPLFCLEPEAAHWVLGLRVSV